METHKVESEANRKYGTPVVPRDGWESKVDTNKAKLLARIARRLPSLWRQRRRIRSLVKSQPRLDVDLSLPSDDDIFSWIEELCVNPHRRPGSLWGQKAEDWLEAQLQAMGLEVHKDPIPIHLWEAESWSLKVGGQEIPAFFVLNSAFTPKEGLHAPLVDLGTGREADYNRVDVSGKIVVAEITFPDLPTGPLMRLARLAYHLSDPNGELGFFDKQKMNYVRQNFVGGASEKTAADDAYWRAHRRGAVGIVMILRDQPSHDNSHYGPYDGIMKPLPGLWVSKDQGARLRSFARAGVEAEMVLQGSLKPSVMHNVWGYLPGQSERVIMLNSHHDSPHLGVVEDGSGVAQVLAQAQAWSQLPLEQRPRSMVFMLDAGHFYGSEGAHYFARTRKDIMDSLDILITLEHLASKEVREENGRYVETGRLAFSALFTSPIDEVAAAVTAALQRAPARMSAAIPSDLFGPAPTSDAIGYVVEAQAPIISWVAGPYYLLDAADSLEMIERSELQACAKTTAEIVRIYMGRPK